MSFLLFLLAVFAISYLVSLTLHPRGKVCGKCKGTGIHKGAFFTYANRACTKCGGAPMRARLGLRVFHSSSPVWGESRPRTVAAKRSQKWGR